MESDASSARYLFFIRRTNDYINMDNDEGKKKLGTSGTRKLWCEDEGIYLCRFEVWGAGRSLSPSICGYYHRDLHTMTQPKLEKVPTIGNSPFQLLSSSHLTANKKKVIISSSDFFILAFISNRRRKSQSLAAVSKMWTISRLKMTIISDVCVFFNSKSINKSNKFSSGCVLRRQRYLRASFSIKAGWWKKSRKKGFLGGRKAEISSTTTLHEHKQFSSSVFDSMDVWWLLWQCGRKAVISWAEIYKDIFLFVSIPRHPLMMSPVKLLQCQLE